MRNIMTNNSWKQEGNSSCQRCETVGATSIMHNDEQQQLHEAHNVMIARKLPMDILQTS